MSRKVVEEGSISAYIQDLSKLELISEKEEKKLTWMVRGDAALDVLMVDRHMVVDHMDVDHLESVVDVPGSPSAHRLVSSHLRLVVLIASKYYKKTEIMPLEDLIQVGNLALVNAVAGFNPSIPVRFMTYAGRGVWRDIIRCIKKARQHQLLSNQQNPDREEPEVNFLANANRFWEKPINHRNEFIDQEYSDFIKQKMEEILGSSRSMKIIDRHLGLTEHEKTLKEVGYEFGISPQRVGQIEAKAFEKIRSHDYFANLLDADW